MLDAAGGQMISSSMGLETQKKTSEGGETVRGKLKCFVEAAAAAGSEGPGIVQIPPD